MYNAELILIVDESGSMSTQRGQTVGSINELIQEQKRLPGDLAITVVAFNTSTRMIHERAPATSVPLLDWNDYSPVGLTALCDSVCDVLDTAKQWSVPDGTDRIVAIITDGASNADSRRLAVDVKSRVDALTAAGWKFIFLASGIDAFRSAAGYGIANAAQVDLTTQVGTVSAYRGLNQTVTSLRAQPAPVTP